MSKKHKISVRLNDEEFQVLQSAAEDVGSNISTHIRRLLSFKEFISDPALYAKHEPVWPLPMMFINDGQND